MSTKYVELESISASGIYKIAGAGLPGDRLEFTNGRARVTQAQFEAVKESRDGLGVKLFGRRINVVGGMSNPGRTKSAQVVRSDGAGSRGAAIAPPAETPPGDADAGSPDQGAADLDALIATQEQARRAEEAAQKKLAGQGGVQAATKAKRGRSGKK